MKTDFQKLLKSALTVVFLLLGMHTALAQAPESELTAGNKSYQAKDFDQAIKHYETALESGWTSAVLEFNLGNAYFKKNQIAPAILHYERAARLNPADEEIDFNLRIAQLKSVDKIDVLPEIFYIRWWRSFIALADGCLWSSLTVGCAWLIVIGLLLFFFRSGNGIRKAGLYIAAFAFVTGIISFLCASAKTSLETDRNTAIVMAPSSYVKSSPDEKGNDLFILHEGTKVELLDELNDWKKIRIANGTIGWINGTTIEVI